MDGEGLIYIKGDIVEHDGKLYESLISDNVNHSPVSSGTDYWKGRLVAVMMLKEKIGT